MVYRFNEHADQYHQLPSRQSGIQKISLPAATAITIVHNDIVRAIGDGDVSALRLSELSAAFDTVDHDVLVDVLTLRFGIEDRALVWFRSYLTNRTQSFCVTSGASLPVVPPCNVPQGSVIGPQKFTVLREDIVDTSTL